MNLWRTWREGQRFRRLPRLQRRIVFYAEGAADWPHLGPLVDHLVGPLGHHISYLTSEADDPILARERSGVHSFYIGTGVVRTTLFKAIEAEAFVMTMPDLDMMFLRRSSRCAHYFYVFHAIMSTLAVYKNHAFDAYDTVCCVGPHHVEEIRATERVYALPPKRLVEHGYGRLDALMAAARRSPRAASRPGPPHVLVAPTWGPSSIVATCLEDLLRRLLDAGMQVMLRLHTMTMRERPRLAADLHRRFSSSPTLVVETDRGSEHSLIEADVMVSDWSGAALEFAVALEKPDDSIDTPQKIRNPEASRTGLTACDADLRPQLGAVVSPRRLETLVPTIEDVIERHRPERLRALRKRYVFNVGSSASVGATVIAETIAKTP